VASRVDTDCQTLTYKSVPSWLILKEKFMTFFFNDLLLKLNLDPGVIRLVRHDSRGLQIWQQHQREGFGCFASFQNKGRSSPYLGVSLVCHFVPGRVSSDGYQTAMFIGFTQILDSWEFDGLRLPRLQHASVIDGELENIGNVQAFDLEWLEVGEHFAERLWIKWGTPSSTRSWSQWADRNQKEIIELRQIAHEPPFPGFGDFSIELESLSSIPHSWQIALRSVKGVYLLVAPDGQQYVGSASGEDGFFGRWLSYAANGHGGNKKMRMANHSNYRVSILEVSSSQHSDNDIIHREMLWKNKLGSRVFGLNAN
jgi:hypothetical protein